MEHFSRFLDDEEKAEFEAYMKEQKAVGKIDTGPTQNGYRKNPEVACLWWELPIWKKWKYMRQSIREEIRYLQKNDRQFSAQAFYQHLDSIERGYKEGIRRQEALMNSFNSNAAMDEFYRKLQSGEITAEDVLE